MAYREPTPSIRAWLVLGAAFLLASCNPGREPQRLSAALETTRTDSGTPGAILAVKPV